MRITFKKEATYTFTRRIIAIYAVIQTSIRFSDSKFPEAN